MTLLDLATATLSGEAGLAVLIRRRWTIVVVPRKSRFLRSETTRWAPTIVTSRVMGPLEMAL